jgi:hypothetical protein
MTKVTGHKILASIKTWELKKAAATKRFPGSLFAFADDPTKMKPGEVLSEIQKCEVAIAKLQVVQTRYNLLVTVDTKLGRMTLCEAIKTIGGMGRIEGMWKTVAIDNDDNGRVRYKQENLQQEMAKRVMPLEEAMVATLEASAVCGSLKSAIAEGNASSVELEQVDKDLLI